MAWRRNDAQGVWDCSPDFVAALADCVACAKPDAAAVEAALQLADSLQASVSVVLEDANNGEGVAAASQLVPAENVSVSSRPRHCGNPAEHRQRQHPCRLPPY